MKDRNQYIILEEKKVKELATEYKKKGYQVFMYPTEDQTPKFLKGYKPDLIAKNEFEKIIFEIKSQYSIRNSDKLKDYLELISKKEDWTFELVLTNPRKRTIDPGEEIFHTSNKEIQTKLEEVRRLIELNFVEPAFLMLWSIFEAVSRPLINEFKKSKTTATLSIIKELFSYGLINRNDYKNLEMLFKERNNLIHGFYRKGQKITKIKVVQFEKIIVNLRRNNET